MRVTLHGAAGGEVTGSAYEVQGARSRILVDFGLFQGLGAGEKNELPVGLNPAALDGVVVTHGHLDHVGRLPLLTKAGYRGPVWMTPATAEIAALILRDSARLQQMDSERANRKRQRAGEAMEQPLYSVEDAEAVIRLFRPVRYGVPCEVAPGFTARFREAGHMLGSASIQLEEAGRTVVFSGDLGPLGALILKDSEPFERADAVFLESTYGDRDHKPFEATVKEFFDVVRRAVEQRGRILVPTFAVGRAQVLQVLLAWAFRNGKLPPFPYYVDSPMAIEATQVYERHPELYDEDMLAFRREGGMCELGGHCHATVTADESRALNHAPDPCLIMAGAGMCTGGRILHHFRQHLWKPETTVLIVGYQAQGSLGRLLVDGADRVKIHGEPVAVKARVHTLGGFSAHAGQRDLLGWFESLAPSRPRVFLTHGEDRARTALAAMLKERHGLLAEKPSAGAVIDL